MKHPTIFCIFLVLSVGTPTLAHSQAPRQNLRWLQATWMMEAAYEISAEGSRATNSGEHPKGLFLVDTEGRVLSQVGRQAPGSQVYIQEPSTELRRAGKRMRRRRRGLPRLAARRLLRQ